MPTGPYGEQCRGHKKSENAIRTTLLRLSVMRLTSDKPLRCKGLQRIAKYGNMISRGVGDIWQTDEKGVDKIIDKQVKEREHRRRKRLEEHKRKKLLK